MRATFNGCPYFLSAEIQEDKKLKRKLLTTLLAILCVFACAFGLAACGDSNDTDNNGGNDGIGSDKTEHTTHTYNQKTTTATYLKTAADCTHKAVYYYSCTCREAGTETFEYGELAAHKFDNELAEAKYLVSEADYTHKAVYYKSCSVCGEQGTETFEYGEVKKDESKNAYQEVIDALQAKLDDEYGNGAEILTVCNLGDYLGCKVKYGNAVKTVRSATTKTWLDENGKIIDYDKANRLISNGTLWELDGSQYGPFVGLYLSDSESATDKAFVKEMIESRVGTDFDIIYGGVSAVTDVADDYMITNAAKFTVYALIVKDNKVYEYKETLIVSKDNGNVYDTVIGGGTFRSDAKTETELGALADKYYAVQFG